MTHSLLFYGMKALNNYKGVEDTNYDRKLRPFYLTYYEKNYHSYVFKFHINNKFRRVKNIL